MEEEYVYVYTQQGFFQLKLLGNYIHEADIGKILGYREFFFLRPNLYFMLKVQSYKVIDLDAASVFDKFRVGF